MSNELNDFTRLNGKITGCLSHVIGVLDRGVPHRMVIKHLRDVLMQAYKANDEAFQKVQAFRFGEQTAYNKNGAVACHNTLAT